MGLETAVLSKITVTGNNRMYIKNCGQYNIGDSEIETRLAKLYILRHLLDIACECLSESSEMTTLFGTRFETLAEELYSFYKPYIKAGVNIFNYHNYYMRDQLKKYAERPLAGGSMNASLEESTPGLPLGWWHEYEGHAHKWFSDGHIAVYYEDSFIHINTYVLDDMERGLDPINWIHIKEAKDYGELFRIYPDNAAEIAAVCKWVEAQYKI